MVLLQERIGKLLQCLKNLIYAENLPMKQFLMHQSAEKPLHPGRPDVSEWEIYSEGIIAGNEDTYLDFQLECRIPEVYDGQCVVLIFGTGIFKDWDVRMPQFRVYINGHLVQGIDTNHRTVLISAKAKKGEHYRIDLAAFCGDHSYQTALTVQMAIRDLKVEKYYYDLFVPYETACLLEQDDRDYITIIQALNESLNLLDLRKERSVDFYQSLEKAQQYITEEFYQKACGKDSKETVYCVGHTHIDCAWLWTLSVTKDKAVRSFSTVLELMKEYPAYIFMSSQPQLYEYVRAEAPEIYQEIKNRVRQGRWEPEGGMWLEADSNIPSGESLVRQFLQGQRFFMSEFGKKTQILWLPDVFGYSAALPQIMEKCGIRYFMTTKINWNEFDRMPNDTFLWEGIDGTDILTHFIPTRDYHTGAVKGGTETEHYTTYNGYINPSQMKGAWERYSNKDLNHEVLCSFGYGDGGGGPTRDMLEQEARLSRGIPGCPVTKMSTSEEFFHTLEKHVKGSKYLHKWVGELYLEYHRGTYTSMARNKKYNRRAEYLLEDCELYASMADILTGMLYPKEELYAIWREVLKNQFHDILPGSSIRQVYDQSWDEYKTLLKQGTKLKENFLYVLADRISAPVRSAVVFNPNTHTGSDLVSIFATEVDEIYEGDRLLIQQKLKDGKILFQADGVPGKGYKTYSTRKMSTRSKSKPEDLSESGTFMRITPEVMENQFFRICLNKKGQFSSIYDKSCERDLLKPGQSGNVLMTYEDRPHNYDAWDLNNYYTEKSWEVDDVQEIVVTEDGPLRGCVRITRHYLDSEIVQYVYLYASYAKIDIKNEICWKEHQIFLKSLFPVDIHAEEATYDIQYGNVRRPVHTNTSWDFARFEVCMHNWMDFSEDDYGVSILNDCKYGCSVRDGVIGISLLKSAVYPNPEADKEDHEFTLSILPHKGGWREGGTVHAGYMLNNPLQMVMKKKPGGELSSVSSFVTCDAENVFIEVIKQAEDDDALILRLYECYNRRTRCRLSFFGKWAAAVECNMLEEEIPSEASELSYGSGRMTFVIKPYEIKTFKLTKFV